MNLDFAKRRISSALNLVEHISQDDFPYDHPRDALRIMSSVLSNYITDFNDADTFKVKIPIQQLCMVSLETLFLYQPIIGFILRSINARNSFELYPALLRLCRMLFGPSTKLILSSEWEFSPYTFYTLPSELSAFTLIGMPSSESSNPLLIPLAGHEIGHSAWKRLALRDKLSSKFYKSVLAELKGKSWNDFNAFYPYFSKVDLDLVARHAWIDAVDFALYQAEEIFCDLFGLRIFAESYLYALEYLLSPGFRGSRTVLYPSMSNRISNLCNMANTLDVIIPKQYIAGFVPEDKPGDDATGLLLRVADIVSQKNVNYISNKVTEYANAKRIPFRDHIRVKEIQHLFQDFIIPVQQSETFVDIINAAWLCRLDSTFLSSHINVHESERYRVLNDLVFKSLEIVEILQVTSEEAD